MSIPTVSELMDEEPKDGVIYQNSWAEFWRRMNIDLNLCAKLQDRVEVPPAIVEAAKQIMKERKTTT